MTTTTNPLRDPAFMEAFLNLVIPPSADGVMPGAGSLGLGEAIATSVEADTRFGHVVSNGLQSVFEAALVVEPAGLPALLPADRVEVVQSVLGDHPMLMVSVSRYLYIAYYQHPRILAALGEPARAPFPEGFEIEPTDERLLAALHARRQSPAS